MNRRTRHKALVWIVRPAARSPLREGPDAPEVLLLERPETRGGGLHPVTGKANRGERPEAAAEREVREETGFAGELRDLGFHHEFVAARPGKKETRWVEHAWLLSVPAGSAPQLSDEHVAARWVPAPDAAAVLEWAAHRETLALALAAWSALRGA